jgi:hypothetical protein
MKFLLLSICLLPTLIYSQNKHKETRKDIYEKTTIALGECSQPKKTTDVFGHEIVVSVLPAQICQKSVSYEVLVLKSKRLSWQFEEQKVAGSETYQAELIETKLRFSSLTVDNSSPLTLEEQVLAECQEYLTVVGPTIADIDEACE